MRFFKPAAAVKVDDASSEAAVVLTGSGTFDDVCGVIVAPVAIAKRQIKIREAFSVTG